MWGKDPSVNIDGDFCHLTVTLQKFPRQIKRKIRMVQHSVIAMVAAALVAGCGGSPKSPDVAMTKESPETAVAGVNWSYPSRWVKSGPRMMRAATYTIPSATEGPEGGECAVFFFGAGQGGDVELNIQRWETQFQNGVTAEKKDRTVGEIPVTTVAIEGSYLSPGGPMMQSQGVKENYKLLGAVIQAPEGMVFFKLTAPKVVADAVSAEFDAMVESIVKL